MSVYLKGAQPPPGALHYLKQELASLMHSAGVRVEWSANSDSEMLAVVEFSGDCTPPSGYTSFDATRPSGTPLASTVVTDGRVLPFATVNCAAISRSIGGALAKLAPAQRDFFYGRALARVIAHELYHMVTGTGDHTRNGISRSCFSATDLTTERFEFEGAALAQLRRHTEPAAVAEGDDAADRANLDPTSPIR